MSGVSDVSSRHILMSPADALTSQEDEDVNMSGAEKRKHKLYRVSRQMVGLFSLRVSLSSCA